MKSKKVTRRSFLTTVSAGAVAASSANILPKISPFMTHTNDSGKLAALGGTPVAKNLSWPAWPYVDEKMVDKLVETAKDVYKRQCHA